MVDQKIEQDAIYASSLARHYIDVLRENNVPLERLQFLEIGPGANIVHAFALKAAGVEVTLADLFISTWNDFNDDVARLFVERWCPDAAAMVEQAKMAGRYPFRLIGEPAEELGSVSTESMGAVFSHAVLEHVYDLPAAARELYRVTRPGGLHRHQIDFRDHHDFSQPLEFLLMNDAEFVESFRDGLCPRGNRWRPSEVVEIFYDAGFEICSIHPDTFADRTYLENLLPRLRAQIGTRFAYWPRRDLITLGARFIWRKPL
jgi:ubiquinone/menaquinone biosynthesis C-methylase UbiE